MKFIKSWTQFITEDSEGNSYFLLDVENDKGVLIDSPLVREKLISSLKIHQNIFITIMITMMILFAVLQIFLGFSHFSAVIKIAGVGIMTLITAFTPSFYIAFTTLRHVRMLDGMKVVDIDPSLTQNLKRQIRKEQEPPKPSKILPTITSIAFLLLFGFAIFLLIYNPNYNWFKFVFATLISLALGFPGWIYYLHHRKKWEIYQSELGEVRQQTLEAENH